MKLWNADKIMDRMDQMLDNAMAGNRIETEFDETKMSALETKLAKYLAMNQASKEELLEEKEKINTLISDISHQTKTPIANLLLYTELLKEKELDDNSKKLVEALTFQTQKLSFLIVELIKASRLENGIIQTAPEENDVEELLKNVVAQAIPKAEKKKILLNCDTTEGKARFDLKWTTEALVNIVDNAIKYTNDHGEIHINVTPYQMFVRIDIQDNGIGIEEEEIPKIFSRFYRADEVSEIEGVGLGLYLARQIITSQKGYIKVTSEKKTGSTFSVFLPAVA